MCQCCGCVGCTCRLRALFRIAVSIVERGAIPAPVPVGKLRLSWISLQPRARHTCEELWAEHPLYIAQASIFCSHFILLLTFRATRAPYRSLAGPPSNCGVSVRADVTHDECERHRACPSVKPLTEQPFHVHLHARTLRGAALSS